MSWFEQHDLNWIQMTAAKILSNGPIPQHVGLLPDGSRRYAKANGLSRVAGQTEGLGIVMTAYQWCVALGIPIVTIFGMSVRNLKRSEEEVNDLWQIYAKMFEDILANRELLHKLGVRFRIIGESSEIPRKLRILGAKIMTATKDNNKRILNFALSYTATHEITQTVKDIVLGVEKGQIIPEDINKDLVAKCLYTGDLPEPDLIIRTSGEVRLSEFLLWQTTSSCLYFDKAFWPEFGVWNLMAAVFYYQRCYADLEEVKRNRLSLVSIDNNNRVMDFIDELHRIRERAMEKM